ncbi:MAG: hypothetical protein R2828_29525 [Saprospiraceae bacterium]
MQQRQGEPCSIRMIDSSKFSKLPNSVIGVHFEKFELDSFNTYETIQKTGIAARKGNDFVSFEHYRNYWEIGNVSIYRLMYNGGVYSCFYKPTSSAVKNQFPAPYYKSHKSINLRNADYHYESGVGYGKFGDYLDAHLLRKGMMFTSEGLAISKIPNEKAISLLSYLNSNIARYLLNLFSGLHKQAGYVNLLPFPIIKIDLNKIIEIIKVKRDLCFFDETVIEYRAELIKLLNSTSSFSSMLDKLRKLFDEEQKKYQNYIGENNNLYEQAFGIDKKAKIKLIAFSEKLPHDPISELISVTTLKSVDEMVIPETLMNIVGIAFGRWDLDKISDNNKPGKSDDIFSELGLFPDIYIIEKNKVLNDISVGKEYVTNEELSHKCRTILREINPDAFQNFQSEIDELFDSLPSYFLNYNGYFAYHLNRYTKNRRVSPIYWPLATKSNSYIIWVYYPELTENTLFSIINELIDPQINMISDEVDVLKLNNPSKELNTQKEFLAELQDFKEELLQIAKLPYRPNQDDGVLITAAPLHNLFRHTKWKKDTEDCWKQLQKGEYDWAHLAYSIWPDRVKEKCKKDLSMAIAHDLEDICEVKPKETKPREKKGVKVDKQGKLL